MAIMSHAPLAAPESSTVRSSLTGRALWLSALLILLLPTGGCVYRMAVQQGNFLDARQVTQVQVGMTRAQVRFLLGTPMLPDAFDSARWDYLYTLQVAALKCLFASAYYRCQLARCPCNLLASNLTCGRLLCWDLTTILPSTSYYQFPLAGH